MKILKNMFIIAVLIGIVAICSKSLYALSGNDLRGVNTAQTEFVSAINASGMDLVDGDVVVWDYNYGVSSGTAVSTTTTVNNPAVAGVWKVITGTRTTNGNIGNVQVYGYCASVRGMVDYEGDAVTARPILRWQGVATSTIAGYCALISTSTNATPYDVGTLGVAMSGLPVGTDSTSTLPVFIKCLGR